MEMSISHRNRAEVSKKSDIWKAEAGHRCDTEEAVRVQACGNHRSACDAGSYTHAAVDTAEVERGRLHGISEREKHLNDI